MRFILNFARFTRGAWLIALAAILGIATSETGTAQDRPSNPQPPAAAVPVLPKPVATPAKQQPVPVEEAEPDKAEPDKAETATAVSQRKAVPVQPPVAPMPGVVRNALGGLVRLFVGKKEMPDREPVAFEPVEIDFEAEFVEAPVAANIVLNDIGGDQLFFLNGNAGAFEIRALVEQQRLLYEPHYRAELRFVHQVCFLKKSEFLALKADTDRVFEKALVRSVQGIRGGRNAKRGFDVHKTLEDALMASTHELLSDDQATVYQAEIDQRRAFRKEADVDIILLRLDRHLSLSEQQRQALQSILRKAWVRSWHWNARLLHEVSGALPIIPVNEISPLLSSAQRKILKVTPRLPVTVPSFAFRQGRIAPPVDRPLEEELEFAPEDEEAP